MMRDPSQNLHCTADSTRHGRNFKFGLLIVAMGVHRMKPAKLAFLVAMLALLAGAAFADIPGLVVVQEARIDDPTPGAATERSWFGRAGIASIGDFDGDGIDDLIAGAPKANLDSGSLIITLLTKNGTPKSAPIRLLTRDTKLSPKLGPGGYDQFGYGIAVIRQFSKLQPCAIVLTNSGTANKIWSLKICNEQGNPAIREVVVTDANSAAFSGVSMQSVGVGNAMSVLDTTTNGERVVALGNPSDGATSSSFQGRVIIVAVDTGSMILRQLSLYPTNFNSTDPFGSTLVNGEQFGVSIAPIRGINGAKGMAVVSNRYLDASSNPSGRIHLIAYNANYSFGSEVILAGTSNYPVTQSPISIASADFDHDGVSDLVVGYNLDVLGPGGFQVSLMNVDGTVKASTYVRKGEAGLKDTANGSNAIVIKSMFGIQVVTTDFDHDGQLDIVVGSTGNPKTSATQIIGSIWPIRMKQLPRKLREIDTLTLTKTDPKLRLSDYLMGNRLGWTLSELQAPPTTLVKCSLNVVTDTTYLHCIPGTTNGISKWRAIATDSGNIPATLHFADTLDFVVRIIGQDSAPVPTAALPKVRISEDQKDTAVLVLSHFFRDPELKPLTFSIAPLNNSTTGPLSYLALSVNTDTLHLAGKAYHPGLCSLRVDVKDNANAIISDTLVIDVFHVNHAPRAFDTAYTITESVPTTLSVRSLDYDIGDILAASVLVSAKHGTAVIQGSQVLYKPDSFYLGPDSIQFKVSDGQGSDTSMIRLTVTKTSATAKVYKPLADLTIDEDAPSFLIRVDSLFFSGAERFAVRQDEAITDCETQKIALVKNDRVNFRLSITPLPNQSGRCHITIPTLVDPKDSSSMFLNIKSVVDLYKYTPDTLTSEVMVGNTSTINLDSVDLDRDTLVHKTITTLPDWVQLDGFRLTFKPTSQSKAAKILIESRKKSAPGVTYLDPTDTLILYAIPTTNTSVGRRFADGVKMSNQFGKLRFQAGSVPFKISLFTLDGHVLIARDVPEMGQTEVERNQLPPIVYVRLTVKNKTTISPLFLNSSN